MVCVFLHYIVVYHASLGSALRARLDNSASDSRRSLCIKRIFWSDLEGLLPHVQYDCFAAGDLNRLSGPVRQHGPGERRHVGDRAARGLGLIFTNDPEALRRRFDDFRARAPRSPVTDFPQSSGCGLFVAFVCCGAVRPLETVESGLNGGEPRFGHKIAVRRYRPFRKFGVAVLVFFDEGAAHCGLPVLHRSLLGLEGIAFAGRDCGRWGTRFNRFRW